MESTQKYFGGWEKREDLVRDFEDQDVAADSEILLATYEDEAYSGDAFVLFEHDGKLYEVHGSHCSCYGLEGQWAPEETTWVALAMRPRGKDAGYHELNYHTPAAVDLFWQLVDSHVQHEGSAG